MNSNCSFTAVLSTHPITPLVPGRVFSVKSHQRIICQRVKRILSFLGLRTSASRKNGNSILISTRVDREKQQKRPQPSMCCNSSKVAGSRMRCFIGRSSKLEALASAVETAAGPPKWRASVSRQNSPVLGLLCYVKIQKGYSMVLLQQAPERQVLHPYQHPPSK